MRDWTWNTGWDRELMNAAKAHVFGRMIAAKKAAQVALKARHPSVDTSILTVTDWDTKDGAPSISLAYKAHHKHFWAAFVETGTPFYAPTPVITPSVLNTFHH